MDLLSVQYKRFEMALINYFSEEIKIKSKVLCFNYLITQFNQCYDAESAGILFYGKDNSTNMFAFDAP